MVELINPATGDVVSSDKVSDIQLEVSNQFEVQMNNRQLINSLGQHTSSHPMTTVAFFLACHMHDTSCCCVSVTYPLHAADFICTFVCISAAVVQHKSVRLLPEAA